MVIHPARFNSILCTFTFLGCWLPLPFPLHSAAVGMLGGIWFFAGRWMVVPRELVLHVPCCQCGRIMPDYDIVVINVGCSNFKLTRYLARSLMIAKVWLTVHYHSINMSTVQLLECKRIVLGIRNRCVYSRKKVAIIVALITENRQQWRLLQHCKPCVCSL